MKIIVFANKTFLLRFLLPAIFIAGMLQPAAAEVNYETDFFWESPGAMWSVSAFWADFDGDWDLDLAVGAYEGTDIVFENIGGVFSPTWVTDLPLATHDVAAADLDGDGDGDLVVCNYTGANVIYWNKDGVLCSFTEPGDCWVSETFNETTSTALGDVDNDGDLDIVFGNENARNSLFINNGGTFETTPQWQCIQNVPTTDVAWCDFDNDGWLDLITVNDGSPDLIYYNNGQGALNVNYSWSSGIDDQSNEVTAGDFDGDGYTDFAIAGTSVNPTRVIKNQDGVPTLFWSEPAAEDTMSVDLADIDSDGDLDLITGTEDGVVKFYLFDGTDFSDTPDWQTFFSGSTCIAAADADGDADLDLAVGVYGYKAGCLRNVMDLLSAEPVWQSDYFNLTMDATAADLFLDGYPEPVFANNDQRHTAYFNFEGIEYLPSWSSAVPFNTASPSVAAADLFRDGYPELLFTGIEGMLSIYGNDEGSLSALPVWWDEVDYPAEDICLFDIDSDRYPDIVLAGKDRELRYNFNIIGDFGRWRWETIGQEKHYKSLSFGDINNDGHPDLTAGSITETDEPGAVSVFLNYEGKLNSDTDWFCDESGVTRAVGTADFDGDGWEDVIWAGAAEGVRLYRNINGVLETEASVAFNPESDIRDICLKDVNNDGYIDMFLGAYESENLFYLNHNGTFYDEPDWISAEDYKTTALTAADTDGDGDFDLIEGSYNTKNAVYENRYMPAPLLVSNPPYALITTPELDQHQPFYLEYYLFGEPGQTCTIEIEHSTSLGGYWHPCTWTGTGEGFTGLAASPQGTVHYFHWDIDADAATASSDKMLVRITAYPENVRTAADFQRLPISVQTDTFSVRSLPRIRWLKPANDSCSGQYIDLMYILSEPCDNPLMIMQRTGGNEDPNSPHELTEVISADQGMNIHSLNGLDLNNDGDTTTDDVLADGAYYSIYFSAQDMSGNIAEKTVDDWLFDMSAPSSEITFPEDGSYIPPGALTIQGTFEDGQYGCGVYRVFVDINQDTYVAETDEDEGTWSYEWPGASAGTFTFTSRAEDYAENLEDEGFSITVTIDDEGPATEITVPEDEGCLDGESHTFEGVSADEGIGVELVEVSLDNGETWMPAQGTEEWTFDWTEPTIGLKTLKVRAFDAFDHQGNTASVNFFSNTQLPYVDITSPVPDAVYSGTELVAAGVAASNGPELIKVEGRLDGGDWLTAEGTVQWSLTLEDLDEGVHQLDVRAQDQCERYSQPLESVTFHIDNKGPSIWLGGYLTTRAFSDDAIDITLAGYTEDPGVTGMELYYNGEPTGLKMNDSGSGVYELNFSIPDSSCFPGDAYLIQIGAEDSWGNVGDLWPAFHIGKETEEFSQYEGAGEIGAGPEDVTQNSPYILAAGQWDTELDDEGEGTLKIWAIVGDPQGASDVQNVELFFNREPTGTYLPKISDSTYVMEVPLEAGMVPPDDYVLELRAADQDGNVSEIWPYLNVIQHPLTVSCQASPPSVDVGQSVHFSRTVQGGVSPFNTVWNFGDGTSAQGTSVNHSYAQYGSYQVQVIVTDCLGVAASSSVTVNVTPCTGGMEVYCYGEPRSGDAPLEVDFSASVSCGTPPYSYSWNFGDGSAGSSEPNPSHTYTDGGSFQACVTVDDSTGASKVCCLTVTVGVVELVVVASADPTHGLPGSEICFDAEVTGGVPPYDYSWDFNTADGIDTDSTQKNPCHTYNSMGVYTARITVHDANGTSAYDEINISIEESHITDHQLEPENDTGGFKSTVFLSAPNDGDRLLVVWSVNGEVCREVPFNLTPSSEKVVTKLIPIADCGASVGDPGIVKLYYNDVHYPEFDRSFEVY